MNDARQNLICILQSAYSGEMAAAFAYRGHWRSLKKSAVEREKIRQIEAEEWAHREEVGKWLAVLEAKPRKVKEAVLWTIGKTLGNLFSARPQASTATTKKFRSMRTTEFLARFRLTRRPKRRAN